MDYARRISACAFGMMLFAGAPALADGMRCQERLVSLGDSTYDARSLCGVPDAAEHRIEVRTVRRQVSVPCSSRGGGRCTAVLEDSVEVPVELWTYDFGPQRFVRFLTFESGKLIQIDSGGYGHKQN